MTPTDALAIVRAAGVGDRFVVSGHARARMRERNVQRADIRTAMAACRRCVAAPDDRWRVDGPDLDGDDLTIIVAIAPDVVVVTVY